jgi:site-specific DNA-methyltransferase (cytosine-N4-specific)
LSVEGSLVLEIGNSWDPGQPSMSLLPLQALLAVVEETGFTVCQQFICHNPARLPGPAQWVTVNRMRMKDTYTHVWWLARSPWVKKADNRKVLAPYSDSMKRLLKRKSYNSGLRPSGHQLSDQGFVKDHGGSIPSNVLSFANTSDDKNYVVWCKERGVKAHPARMPRQLAQFFIDFLTDEGDLVWDSFAGSLTTASVAESANRRWLATEMSEEYLRGSLGRFIPFAQYIESSDHFFENEIEALRKM